MKQRIVDLSLGIFDGAPTYDEDPQCHITWHTTIANEGSNCTHISISAHQCTHVDAPLHFVVQGNTVDRLPIEACVGPAYLIDFSFKKRKEPINVADFLPYADRIVPGARIVYRTGFDKVFPDAAYLTEFPFMTKEAADWLASRRIALIGMDTPTPNPVDFTAVHLSLLGNDVIIVEGMANLDQLTAGEPFVLQTVPLKILGAEAAPARAFAIITSASEGEEKE